MRYEELFALNITIKLHEEEKSEKDKAKIGTSFGSSHGIVACWLRKLGERNDDIRVFGKRRCRCGKRG